jgi:branched-chain amino acid transport system ATP-binding protein
VTSASADAVGTDLVGRRPVLEVKDLAVHYGGIRAVDGLNLVLNPGTLYGLIGPNGSGKSTLLGALSRLVRPTRGSLLLQGRPYHHVPPAEVARRGIARTFQTVRLLEGLTVRENIMLGADLTARGKERNGYVHDAMVSVGLEGMEHLWPSEMSYGFQRRVEIARAIVMRPQLLLLDEPMAGMAQDERREVSLLLKTLRGRGLTQLLVEHDVQIMYDTCDQIFAMNSGVLIASGSPDAVVNSPAVREAYLGTRWKNA